MFLSDSIQVVLQSTFNPPHQTWPEGSLRRSCGSQGPTSIKYRGDLCLSLLGMCVFFNVSKLLHFYLLKTRQHRLYVFWQTLQFHWPGSKSIDIVSRRKVTNHPSINSNIFQSIWQFPKFAVPEQLEIPFINSIQKTKTSLKGMVWGMVHHFPTFSGDTEVLLSWFLLLQSRRLCFRCPYSAQHSPHFGHPVLKATLTTLNDS